jgi:hypothetical protein
MPRSRPLKVGDEWHVKAIWPSGQAEWITGFKTEADAKAWIAGDDAKTWLRSRGYQDG